MRSYIALVAQVSPCVSFHVIHACAPVFGCLIVLSSPVSLLLPQVLLPPLPDVYPGASREFHEGSPVQLQLREHGQPGLCHTRHTSSMLDDLLSLLEYPLPLKYCKRRFGARSPSWSGLVTQGGEEGGLRSISVAASVPAPACVVSGGAGSCWVEGAGGSWKRLRLTRKTPSCWFSPGFGKH